MSYLELDTYDLALREELEGVARAAGIPLAGSGAPTLVVRTAKEQEERGTSSVGPLAVAWDPARANGGGNPFSYGLLRHLVSSRSLCSAEGLAQLFHARGERRAVVHDERGESYRARLVDARARPSFEAAIVNDLTRLDVDSRASARVLKAMVSLTTLVSSEPGGLSWPLQARFGASATRVWLQLMSGATLSPEQLLGELSRGYLGAFRARDRAKIPAMGWFFALRQVDAMRVELTGGRTEVFVSWERAPENWSWYPSFELAVAGRRAWRRARRYAVDWPGALRGSGVDSRAQVRNLSSLGAYVQLDRALTAQPTDAVQLELELPGADAAPMLRLDGAVRYVDLDHRGLAIEFAHEARGLGHALERLQLAG